MMIPGFPDAMPLEGLIGGGLIGLAAAVMLLGAGKIAGVSGITARASGLAGGGPDVASLFFVAGLPLGAFVASQLLGGIEQRFSASLPMVVIAGLIVGYGTRLGSGCTSGHGVCGMSRLSRRSIIATMTFIASGMATVTLANLIGWGW